MSVRRLAPFALVTLAALLLWLFLPRPESATVTPGHPTAATAMPTVAPSAKPEARELRPTPLPPEALKTISLAADLNAPGGNITADLQMLNNVMTDWRRDYPEAGNPVGENAEITAVLAGDNPLRLSFIARNHRAINSDGELCDRWGTPFRFHALSGRRMELRSAGPDQKFGTEDDALLTPP